MNAKYFGWIVICFLNLNGYCQFLNNQNAIPPSPEVASFAKNIDIPMNYSSGVPEIAIPIASVKSGLAEIPVSLSYNASGIRVEETPTWVGLGFNLNAGGEVARVIRGLPDDGTYGYMHSASNRTVKYVAELPENSEERYYIELQALPEHQIDLEPDIFTFSVMGYSGEFFWNQDSGKFMLSPYQNVRLEYTSNLSEFDITLPNGVKCYFGGVDSTIENISYSATTSRVNGVSYDTPVEDPDLPYNTTWYIHKIIDPSGQQISFSYIREQSTEYGRGGEVFTPGFTPDPSVATANFFKRYIQQPVLQKISGKNADVFFKRSSTVRQDVLDNRKSLDTISIKDKKGNLIKSFALGYGYFTSTTSTSVWGIAIPYETVAKKRLYLKTVTECKGSASFPPYEFTYNSTELPDRLSVDQDYWGYYNGKANPTNGIFALMPKIPLYRGEGIPGLPPELPTSFIPGADRRIDVNYAQARTLTKIKYPTGGTTEYFYESNNVPLTYFNEEGLELPDMVDRSYTFMPLIPANPPYPLYYKDTFRIFKPATKVKITPNLPSPCSDETSSSCRYTIVVKSLPDTTQTQIYITTTPAIYPSLPQGLYRIEAFVTGDPGDMPAFSVNLSWGEFPDSFNFKVGGLRVKKIVSRDNTGGTVSRTFNYNLFFSSPYSSGILAGYPVHLIKRYDLGGNFLGIDQIVSNSPLPLTTDGQTVRYEFVTQYQDSTATSLKTEYSYSSDFANFSFGDNTGAPPTLHSWKNNILTRKSAYEKTGTDYRILSDEWNFYTSHKSFEDLFGMIANHLKKYYIASEWYLLDSTASIDYSYPATTTKTLQTGVKYLYNDSFLVSKTRTRNSLGKLMESKTWYPFDYNDISGYNMATLMGAHDMSVPVKQETSVNGKIKSGTITKYNAMAQPVELFNYEGAALSDTVTHSRNTILESGYVSKGTLTYQADNPLQITMQGNSITSYIWDYSGNYPIAKVIGGSQADIAYTSFEADGKGNWAFSGSPATTSGSVTGKQAYLLSGGSISRTGLTSSVKYIVSYWLKSGGSATVTGGTQSNNITGRTVGNFIYHEVTVTTATTVTISGSGYIDEVRLYPSTAQMTTYTYEPLIGMSSQCDANNHISYYEYDDLNRLDLVRDQDGNIVKRICYNYAGQPESNCVIPGAYATWEFKNVHSTISGGYYTQTGDLYLELRNSDGDPLTTHDPLTINFNAVQQYIDVDGTTVLATQSNPVSSLIPNGTSDFLYVSDMSIKHYPVDGNGNQTGYSYQASAEITPGTGYIILNP